ncbi:alpha/beta hydrolase family domain-containing protein [Ditylenchus destructor]|nr:alpha/beta hydrolase family domain-containing protein [Ditylenchus destructor]
MSLLVQKIVTAIGVVSLTVFWSIFTIVKLFIGWCRHKDDTGRSFFTPRNHQTPPKCLTDGPWTHGFLQLSNIRMHFVEAGDKNNPLMVLLHGFPEFWYSYRFQLKHFKDKYRVVALDMRGFGESDKPTGIDNYNPALVAADVAEAIVQLGGKAILVGHDFGALVSWILAMQRPELIADRLIILSLAHPVAFMNTMKSKPSQFLKSWYMFLFQCPYLAELYITVNDFAYLDALGGEPNWGLVHQENFTDEDYEAYKYVMSKPGASTPMLNYYRALMRVIIRQESPSGHIKPKTLIIFGDKDAFLDVEGAISSIPLCRDARLERIPDASHFVQQDTPAKVNALIEEFIQ